ncbi:hypothetical protein RB597_009305 [Gaeumannomyces tritici]
MRFSPWLAALLGAARARAADQSSLYGNSTDACAQLASALPGKTSFPDSALYGQSKDYWSAFQAALSPACFFYPESTADVSVAMKLLASLSAPFTVKSGGHTPYAGGSNIQAGVTIDLIRLNQVTVSADRQTVSVGPGNRWGNVSAVLDPLGLGVVGGRVGQVGVSGLTLGGGISYFSNRRGWACDNVRAFEVVLSSGRVVVATPARHPDLFWALRGGGGSHFGLVTRFDLEAFPQVGGLWRRLSLYSLASPSAAQLMQAYADLGLAGLDGDPDGHNFMFVGDMAAFGGGFMGSFLYHSNPAAADDPLAVPPVFADMASVPGSLQTTTDVANVSARLLEIGEPNGLRKGWTSVAIRLTPDTAALLRDVVVPEFQAHVARLRAAAASLNVTDEALNPGMSWHVVTATTLRAMQRNGGNALGLRPEDGPLIHMNTIHGWSRPELDELVEAGLDELTARIERGAAARGLDSRYKYLNYAGRAQRVYEGYGAENHARLRRVAAHYDPDGVLRRLWRGYIKL